jgi:hypothetical protein
MKTKFCLALAAAISVAGLTSAQGPMPAAPPLFVPPSTPGNAVPPQLFVPPSTPGNAVSPQPEGVFSGAAAPAEEERLWLRGEYLLWWFKDSPLRIPTLAPTGPVASALAGIEARAAALDEDIGTGTHSGARFTAGLWPDGCGPCGVETSYFFLPGQTTTQDFPPAGVSLGALGSIPDGIGVLRLTSRLQGVEANGVLKCLSGPNLWVQLLTGFRFLELREHLALATNPFGLLGEVADGRTLADSTAENLFYGWQFGARAEYRRGNVFVNGSARVAVGDMYKRDTIGGAASLGILASPAGAPVSQLGRQQFAVIPEVAVNLGYQLMAGLRAFVGYDFLYLSNVVRPGYVGDVIDVPQAAQNRPAGSPAGPGTSPLGFRLTSSDFWAQGIHCGIEFRY